MRQLHPLTSALLASRGLRNLVDGPVHPFRPEAPNKPKAPSNPKAEERRAARLRATIMKRSEWFPASGMWGIPEPEIERLIKAGISRAVLCEVLRTEPPPQDHASKAKTAAGSSDPSQADRRNLASKAISIMDAPYIPADQVELAIQTGMVFFDDAGPVPREVWDSLATTEQQQGGDHGNADIAGGDDLPDPGRGAADPGGIR